MEDLIKSVLSESGREEVAKLELMVANIIPTSTL